MERYIVTIGSRGGRVLRVRHEEMAWNRYADNGALSIIDGSEEWIFHPASCGTIHIKRIEHPASISGLWACIQDGRQKFVVEQAEELLQFVENSESRNVPQDWLDATVEVGWLEVVPTGIELLGLLTDLGRPSRG